MRTVDRGFDFYFNRAKNEAVVREPAGETLLVYRGSRHGAGDFHNAR